MAYLYDNYFIVCLFIKPLLYLTVNPDVRQINATTSTPTPVPTYNLNAAVVAAALVVVALMIMIIVILIVVLKKRQKQVERDYKTPPPNTELQESIMLKNNAAK